MHILMTTDTVGGVWTYTQELVCGLGRRGIRVTLVSFGGLPRAEQTAWMDGVAGLDYYPRTYPLEWMPDSAEGVEESKAYLEALIGEVCPDVLHFNQYCYGDIQTGIPCVVVAHSDVVSWWVEVHGQEPEEREWIRWYRESVTRGLKSAEVVVAPSRWMLEAVRRNYVRPNYGVVIYNGRDPALFDARREKEDFVLSVGRLWDEAKQVSLFFEAQQSIPVCIVGSSDEPGKQGRSLIDPALGPPSFEFLGLQSQKQLRDLYARAAIYGATSCYEPFGLAPLEGALSGCALVANDVPVFHELWGDAAYYFRKNDADALARAIKHLSDDPELRQRYAERACNTARTKFTAEQMAAQYESLYQNVTSIPRMVR